MGGILDIFFFGLGKSYHRFGLHVISVSDPNPGAPCVSTGASDIHVVVVVVVVVGCLDVFIVLGLRSSWICSVEFVYRWAFFGGD